MVWNYLNGMMLSQDNIHNFDSIQYVLYKERIANYKTYIL
jgi:hypothetical protein